MLLVSPWRRTAQSLSLSYEPDNTKYRTIVGAFLPPPPANLLPPLSLPGYQLAGRHSPDLTSDDLIDLNRHSKLPSGRRSFVGQLREAVLVYYPFHNRILQEEYNSVHLTISNDILYHYKSRSWPSFFSLSFSFAVNTSFFYNL